MLTPLSYRLQVGDTQTPVYRVTVYEKPTVLAVDTVYDFPTYLQRPRETHQAKPRRPGSAPVHRAELTIHPSTTIARGHVQLDARTVEGQVAEDGKALVVPLLLKDTTTYTIHLFTPGGHSDPQPRVNQIKVTADAPPTVQLVEPARETSIAAGSKMTVVVRAGDDYGLGEVRIETRSEADSADKAHPDVKTIATWSKFTGSGAVLSHTLELDPARYKAGQSVFVRAVARDRRQIDLPELKLGPQESATPWQQIRLVASEEKVKGDLAQLESLRTALAKILQDQLRARASAAGLTKAATESEISRQAEDLRGQQVNVQKATAAVVASIGSTDDADRLTIKRVASKLAFGEMVQAVRQAEALTQVKSVTELPRPTAGSDGDAGQDHRRPPPAPERGQARHGQPAGGAEEEARDRAPLRRPGASSRT